MNQVSKTTLLDRIKNAIRAFQGKPIQTLYLGLDVKRCDECEYKKDARLCEHLLVVMGARAGYMDSAGTIDIPEGLEEEGKLAEFVKKTVDRYLQEATDGKDVNFDEYIETALIKQYGEQTDEQIATDFVSTYTFDTRADAENTLYSMIRCADMYGYVSILDFKDLVDVKSKPGDMNYGWIADMMDDARVVSTDDGYRIDIRKALAIR